MGKGAYKLTNPNQTPNAVSTMYGSQSVGAKLHRQKGNNPDHQLRSQNHG
jgi:hypothetical protein